MTAAEAETTHVPLADIAVGRRVRSDLGDIDALAKSITEVGLLQPVVVDDRFRLVAGQRRLEAVKRLGWETVPVFPATSVVDAATALVAERDENECRKPMTPSERVVLTERLMDLERPAARERMADGGRKSAPGRPAESPVSADTDLSGLPRTEQQSESNAVRNIAGAAAGWSGASYQRAKAVLDAAADPALPAPVHDAAVELAEQMDAGEIGVSAAYSQLNEAKAVHASRQDPRPPLLSQAEEAKRLHDEGLTNREIATRLGMATSSVAYHLEQQGVPKPRSKEARAERDERIRQLAAEAYTSHQIAKAVGLSPQHLRTLARRLGIEIPADKAVGSTRLLDPNRFVDETVMGLDAHASSLHLMEDYWADLDPARVEAWATSLTDSLRSLNRFSKRLKEMAP